MELSRDGSKNVTDERINTITALVGSMISILVSALIIERAVSASHTWYQMVAVGIYTLGLINLFVMSALHHGLKIGSRVDKVFRTLDYTAIFWLIAGTVSALVAYKFANGYGMAVLIGTWLIAITGIALRASISTLPKHITNTLFISLGWLPAMLLLANIKYLSPQGITLLAVGGLIYSFGFGIYVLEKPNPIKGIFGFHEIWHTLVLVAASLHAVLILTVIK